CARSYSNLVAVVHWYFDVW
nr:immunoglobulin heavy chain junction region [Mus musculus]